MSRKLAIKKLKGSDLSFFHDYLTKNPQAKQKGFNLDKRIIETALFPSMKDVIDNMPGKRAAVALSLFGPGAASEQLLMRKILKQEKNWRLNGEEIYTPSDQLGRYDILAPDDIALIEFSGSSAPNAVKIVLLAAAHEMDTSTHAAFEAAFPGGAMHVLSEDEIEGVIRLGAPPADHPIRDWLDKDLLEDIGNGSGDATERLIAKRPGRGLTQAEFQKAKARAEEVGRLGEELLDHHFRTTPHPDIVSYEWISQVNAISPYDFLLNQTNTGTQHADAKSTGGPFKNPIHLSIGEIDHALRSGISYSIYRLYNVKESSCTFRVARNIAPLLKPIIETLKAMPSGVKVDSLSFDPDYFDFGAHETNIVTEEEPE